MGAVGIRGEDDDTPPQPDLSAPIELTIVRARQARARRPRRSPDTLGQAEPEAVSLRRVAAPPQAPQARPLRRSRKFCIAAAALFAAVSGATFTILYLRQSAAERAEVAPEVIRAVIPVSSLHMRAEAQGDRVLVSWNPRAAGIQSAIGGLLTIEDRTGTRTFPLDASQAANGSVLYRPASGDVTFRLQIQNVAGKVFRDTLRVLDPVRTETPRIVGSACAVERWRRLAAAHFCFGSWTGSGSSERHADCLLHSAAQPTSAGAATGKPERVAKCFATTEPSLKPANASTRNQHNSDGGSSSQHPPAWPSERRLCASAADQTGTAHAAQLTGFCPGAGHRSHSKSAGGQPRTCQAG